MQSLQCDCLFLLLRSNREGLEAWHIGNHQSSHGKQEIHSQVSVHDQISLSSCYNLVFTHSLPRELRFG
jgi:predicted AAA+ superfamily ATPase